MLEHRVIQDLKACHRSMSVITLETLLPFNLLYLLMLFFLVETCMSSPERGPGQNYSVKWFYNSTRSACDRFWYGGEGGNGNRFDNEQDCLAECENAKEVEEGNCTQLVLVWSQIDEIFL